MSDSRTRRMSPVEKSSCPLMLLDVSLRTLTVRYQILRMLTKVDSCDRHDRG